MLTAESCMNGAGRQKPDPRASKKSSVEEYVLNYMRILMDMAVSINHIGIPSMT